MAWTGSDAHSPTDDLIKPTLLAARDVLLHEVALPAAESIGWLRDHAADLRR